MTIFEQVKQAVTPMEVARYYGLNPSRNGMARCPFHPDRHPSMKLNDDYFFCFGCGANGDVIDLASRLLDLNPMDAAYRLCIDFGLDPDAPPSTAPAKTTTFRQQERRCFQALQRYLLLLRRWKELDAPESLDGPFTDRFCEACQMEVYVEDMVDELLFEAEDVRRAKAEELQSILPELEDYLNRKEHADDDAEGDGA